MQKQKRVLMFCTGFFGYDKRIATSLRDEGFEVDLFDERPGTDFLSKTAVRYNAKFFRPRILRYIKSVISSAKKEYDYVFVVKGEALFEGSIELLRAAYPSATFILYLWDSVVNIPDCEKRMKLYDRVFTFDPEDAKRYGIPLRPLFFSEEYEQKEISDEKDFLYDFSFIGTAHTIRPMLVKRLAQICQEKGRTYFSFLYLPHRFVFWYNKIRNRAYRTVRMKDISFSPMSSDQIKEVYRKSRCVLDVEHAKQRGLTMRTVELVGMKKKIITTNPYVKEYDFYNPGNICVIDRENPEIPDAFWQTEYKEIPTAISQRYSLRSFLREIFSLEENEYE